MRCVEARGSAVASDEPQATQLLQFNHHLVDSLSLVLPAFNEEESIAEAVQRAFAALQRYCKAFEIIVVNDGSQDNTGAILEELRGECPNLRIVHHPRNLGYGAALCSGIYSARCGYVSFMDSDLQFDPDEIYALLRWADDYDIVAGYRADRADPWHRKLNAWAWNKLVRLVLGVKIRDLDCAFKVFRRDVFDSIKLEAAGAMVNAEILARARTHGFTLKEIPVQHFPRQHGEQTGANLAVIVKAFRELFSIYGKIKSERKSLRGRGAPAVGASSTGATEAGN